MAESLVTQLEREVESRRNAAYYAAEYDTRYGVLRAWHQDRIAKVDKIIRGDWHLVFPDEAATTEAPKVPNIARLKTSDFAALASSVFPAIGGGSSQEKGKARREKRERIAANYIIQNQVDLLLPRWFTDYTVCGATFRTVLPDAGTGLPKIERQDPRFCYPDGLYTPDRPPQSLIVAHKVSVRWLIANYPEREGEIKAALADKQSAQRDRLNELVDYWRYYDGSEIIAAARIPTRMGRKHEMVLAVGPNKIGVPPFVVSARPTHDGEYRGGLDDVLGVLQAENRMANIMIDHAAEWTYAQPFIQIEDGGIENLDDYGSAKPLILRGRGSVGRMTPEGPNPASFGMLQQMESWARQAAAHPEARSGLVQQDRASAAFVSSIIANLSTEVAEAQRIEAAAWVKMLELCFRTDQTYLDERKPMEGAYGGDRFDEMYLPSRDIKGNYAIRVTYGDAEGGGKFEHAIRTIQAHGNGLVADETAIEKIGMVQDVQREMNRIERERLKKAVFVTIEQQAAMGNPAPAAAAIRILGQDADLMEHIDEIAALVIPAQPEGQPGQAGAAPTGTEAFTEAAGIARGGVSPETNVPGIGSLPPLQEVVL